MYVYRAQQTIHAEADQLRDQLEGVEEEFARIITEVEASRESATEALEYLQGRYRNEIQFVQVNASCDLQALKVELEAKMCDRQQLLHVHVSYLNPILNPKLNSKLNPRCATGSNYWRSWRTQQR